MLRPCVETRKTEEKDLTGREKEIDSLKGVGNFESSQF